MFVGVLSIKGGLFVGDGVVNVQLDAKLKTIVFGESEDAAVDLIKAALGTQVSDGEVGGAFTSNVSDIQNFMTLSNSSKFTQTAALRKTFIAFRILDPIVVKAGIYFPTDDTSGELWLRVAENDKVRAVSVTINDETASFDVIQAINDAL